MQSLKTEHDNTENRLLAEESRQVGQDLSYLADKIGTRDSRNGCA